MEQNVRRNRDDRAYSIVQTSEGGYAIAGVTSGAGGSDLLLVKTDSSGNMEWSETYGGAGYEVGGYVVQTNDGGYALAGSTTSYGAGGYDFWLVKVGYHDVAVTNIKARPRAALKGEPININVTVENQGGFPETFDVTVYADRFTGDLHIDIETRTVSLDVGESRLLEFVWDTAGVPDGSYWLTAEAVLPEDAEPEDNKARTYIGGIYTPQPAHNLSLFILLAPTATAAFTLITLVTAVFALLKLLTSTKR